MNIPDSTNRLQPGREASPPPRQADLSASRLKAAEEAVRASAQNASREIEPPEAPVYARGPEVAEFAERLRELSDIRGDVVDAVKKLLTAGHYGTRDSAEETAKKILGQE